MKPLRLGGGHRRLHAGRLGLAAVWLLLGSGLSDCRCSGAPTGAAAMAVEAIDPSLSVVGERTAVVITGEGFHIPIRLNLNGGADEVGELTVELGDTTLEDVVVEDPTRITAVVPAEMALGVYSVRIVISDGGDAQLPDAYEVTAPITASLATAVDIAVGETTPATLTVTSMTTSAVQVAVAGPVSTAPAGILTVDALALPVEVAAGDSIWANGTVREVRGDQIAEPVNLSVGVTWTYGSLNGRVDASTTIQVLAAIACTDAGDCVDPCRGVAACDAGRCTFGDVDKDSDSDTFIDIACGGTDCNDSDGSQFPGQSWFADCDDDGVFRPGALTSCTIPATDCADGLTPDGGWNNSAGTDCDDEDGAVSIGQDWYADCDGDTEFRDTPLVWCGTPTTDCADSLAPDGGWSNTAGSDCDDEDASLFPGQSWYADCDGDGAYRGTAISSCAAPATDCLDSLAPDGGWSNSLGADCDDEDAALYPTQTWYADCDNDGVFKSAPVVACNVPATDCVDGLTPDGGWSNSQGADCDDEDGGVIAGQTWYADCDGDTFFRTTALIQCGAAPTTDCIDGLTPDGGWSNTLGSDCDDEDATLFPNQDWFADCDADGQFKDTAVASCPEPATDCIDGLTPNGGWSHSLGADCDDEDNSAYPGQSWFADCDNDGTTRSGATTACDQTEADTASPCAGGVPPAGGWTTTAPGAGADCDDDDANRVPGQSWYADCDNDGFERSTVITACDEAEADAVSPCVAGVPPAGGWTTTSPGASPDCNDNDDTLFPGQSWYADCDDDGSFRAAGVLACDQTEADAATPCVGGLPPVGGWTIVDPAAGADCDDEDNAVFPGQLWYADCDNDGAARAAGVVACDQGEADAVSPCAGGVTPAGGWTTSDPGVGADCDDADAAAYPGQSWYADCDGDTYHRATALTACDQIEAETLSPCAGGVVPAGGWSNTDPAAGADCDDENVTVFVTQNWYPDCDDDGFFRAAPVAACSQADADAISPCIGATPPVGGWTNTDPAAGADCDDDDAALYPGKTWYADTDTDTYGDPLVNQISCPQPVDYVDNDLDCDDSCDVCWTDAPELCDTFDNDCDGPADERVPPWRDPAWLYRRALTFDNSAHGQLDEFTVLVILDSATFDYALTDPGGTDLRFVDDDGTTTLPFHIESWDPAGLSYIWVRVPVIDAGSITDFITLYYRNVGAPDVQDEPGSWDASYVGVWHLDQTAQPYLDSTSAGISCDLLGSGNGVEDAAGLINGANEFDGSKDYLDCGTDQIADAPEHTITVWIFTDLTTGSLNQDVVGIEDTSSFEGWGLYLLRTGGSVGTWHDSGYIYGSTTALTPDAWTLAAIRGFNDPTSGYIEVSVNGGVWESLTTGDTSDLTIVAGTPLSVGTWVGGGQPADAGGILDEVRISSTARSQDWLHARYLSETGAFITMGPQEAECP